jgi:ribosomal RNA-processing protein 9
VPSVGGKVPTAAQASLTDLFTATKEGALARYSFTHDLKMMGSPFGQIHSMDTKSGKKGGKASQNGGKSNGGGGKKNGVSDKLAQQGHTGAVLCLVASEDGKYLITGGKDKIIGVWSVEPVLPGSTSEPETAGVKWMRGLTGHKDAVTVRTVATLAKQLVTYFFAAFLYVFR